jgi:hypothetical protein
VVVKGAVEAAVTAETVSRLTEAVIKSTGGAAKVSTEHVADYATKLSNLTGVNRETVQSNENLLLTFTNVKNGVGAGNDIFDQATQTVLNMSAALGEDGKSASIQLGKALQDPIRGITALRRVGVAFTVDQQKQITALVKSGHAMAAQKIILGELKREFGGAAAAVATPFEKLKNTLHNVEVQLGQALLPIFNTVLGVLSHALPTALGTVTRLWRAFTQGFHSPGGDVVGSGMLSGIIRLGQDAARIFRQISTGWHAFLQGLRSPAGDVVGTGFLASMIRAGQAVRRFVDDNGPKVRVFFAHLIADVGTFASRNGPTFIRVLREAAIVFGQVALAIGVVIRWMSKHQTLVQSLAVAIGTIVVVLKAWAIITRISAAATALWAIVTKTSTLATEDMTAAQAALSAVMDANPIMLAVLAIMALAAGLIYAYRHSALFRSIVQGALHDVEHAMGNLAHAAGNFQHALVNAWQFIREAALKTWHGIIDAVHAIEAGWNALKQAVRLLEAVIQLGFLRIIAGALRMALGILSAMARIPGPWQKAFRAARDATAHELGVVEDKVHHAQNVINSIRSPKPITVGVTGSIHWDKNAALLKSLTGNFTHKLPAMASGGLVGMGTTGTADDVLVRVSKGEAVIPAKHVPTLAPALGALGIPGFAGGGLVGQMGLGQFPPLISTVGSALSSLTRILLQHAATLQVAHRNIAAGSFAAGPGGGTPLLNMRLGQAMAAARGWIGAQWDALRSLWMGESGWNNLARNPSSGAFGIPQGLPPAKMGAAAAGGNARAQIAWGEDYIAGRYGSPIGAFSAWLRRSPHWYKAGAWNIPNDQLAMVHKGEMVVPAYAAQAVRAGHGSGGGSGLVVNVNIHGVIATDKRAFIREVTPALRQAIREAMRQEGKQPTV